MNSIRILSGSILMALIAFGCSSSSSPADSCGSDSTVTCTSGSGYSCTGSAVPDTSLNCSDPVTDANGNTDYCCDTGGGDSCGADSTVTCTTAGSSGYSCSGTAVPDASLNCSDPVVGSDGVTTYCCGGGGDSCGADSSVTCTSAGSTGYSCSGTAVPDASLNCSDPVVGSNGDTTYCCAGSTTDSCTADSTVTCMANASGYSCTGSAVPDSTLDCSDPTTVAGGAEYCCFTYTSTTCMADDTVTGCTGDSYGFSCTGTDAPDASDATLTCSDGVQTGSDTIYCCIDNTDASCTEDDSISCPTPGSYGFSCTTSDAPTDPTLTCSTGVANGANTDFCCTD